MNRLDEIFISKRKEVEEARRREPFAAVRIAAAEAEPSRGFFRALQSSGRPLALIAEVKKGSPSRGLIRAEFDAAGIARSYEEAGASALSVLTDAPFFLGSPENLRLARSVTSLPCLRKDFIFDAYQVFESRAWGADAILLIVAALDDLQVTNLMSLAQGLGMDVLVEVHTQEEAERAVRLGAKLIGVNNRSLADLSTDLRTGEAILPTLPDRFTVAESALESQDDLCRMLAAGAKAVLIGTAFCSAPDIKSKVAEVMGW